MEHSDSICVKKVPGKGRGVFAKKPIRMGAIIERVPVLLIPIKDFVGGIENATLTTYLYLWSKDKVAVSLGYGTLYNHSYEPNARYVHGPNMLTYRALCDIAVGQEITINYNFEPDDTTPVAFDVK
jgi:SET domain-containing protein